MTTTPTCEEAAALDGELGAIETGLHNLAEMIGPITPERVAHYDAITKEYASVLFKWCATLLAAVRQMKAEQASLFDAIKHGDDDHKAWLQIVAHFAGKPVPAPRGGGNKDAIIASQSAAIEAKEKALNEIARQKLSDEIDEVTTDCADWCGGYEAIVRIARAALTEKKP